MRSLLRVAVAVVLGASSMLGQAGLKRPAITGIAFVRFAESDPAAAAKFYHDDLGFDALQGAGAGGVTRYPVNDQQWVETVSAPKDGKGRLQAVGFTTRDAKAMQRYLAAKGFQALGPVSGGRFAIHDPEGNMIVFVQTGSQADVARMHPSPRASSHRIIHAGFVVQSAAAEDKLFVDALGFKPYWHGGMKDGVTDFVSQQVPEGSDWLEYMLNVKPGAGERQLGVSDHFSLGTTKMDTVIAKLKSNGCNTHDCTTQQMGRDGKVQLNVFDPDQSRVEFMEYAASGTVCCSPFVGKTPGDVEPR